jgi:hypothetical protein
MRIPLRGSRQVTVNSTGAAAGSVLRGVAPHNKDLRLKVYRDQPKSDGGPIQGVFQLLHAGDNKYSAILDGFLGWDLTAAELLLAIRQEYPQCVSSVNASALAVEQGNDGPDPGGRTGHETRR